MAPGDAKILAKGLVLLDEIARNIGGVSATELADRVGIHKTSVYRYLNTLQNAGYVRNDGDGSYGLGNKILELSSHLLRQMPLRETARSYLVALSNDTQKSVHLCVLDGTEVVYIDKVESQRTLPIMSRIGSHAPAYCTSVGKALLSALPMDQLVAMLGDIGFERRTPNTITSAVEFLDDIRRTQERRYAVDDEEHEEGIVCYAALVREYGGHSVGAISITGLKRDYQEEQERERLLESLLKAAADISSALGFVG